jgi:hypothetical protein
MPCLCFSSTLSVVPSKMNSMGFKTICRFYVAKRMVSKAALAKARMKIKFQAIAELNMHLVTLFEKQITAGTWFGFRLLTAQNLLNVMPTDLILLDSGYPAWWLFSSILSMNANFCARVSCTKWKTVPKFSRSGLAEKIIVLPPSATSVVQYRKMGLDLAPLKLRLIYIENDGNVAVQYIRTFIPKF